MTTLEISGDGGRLSGIYTAPKPMVVILDDEGPKTPHRLILSTESQLRDFHIVAERYGSGFPDSEHILKPSENTPTYLYRPGIKSFTLMRTYNAERPDQNILRLRQYKDKDRLLTGHLEEVMYMYLLEMISELS